MTAVHSEIGHHIGRHLAAHADTDTDTDNTDHSDTGHANREHGNGEHTHGRHAHVDHNYGPSYEGTVVLDIGADVGALVIFTGAAQLGREIEISPAGSTGHPRTHVAVRERYLEDRTLYCAVYPGLAAGVYTIWRDENTPLSNVNIAGAEITQFTWPR